MNIYNEIELASQTAQSQPTLLKINQLSQQVDTSPSQQLQSKPIALPQNFTIKSK